MRAVDDPVRDAYLAAKERHIEAFELARRIVADPIFTDTPRSMASALVDIDEAMREALTDDR